MRLIDADNLKKIITEEHTLWHYTGVCAVIDHEEMIDAVPVVRCKNCVHRSKLDNWCAVLGGYANNYEWYCASGWNGMEITDEH